MGHRVLLHHKAVNPYPVWQSSNHKLISPDQPTCRHVAFILGVDFKISTTCEMLCFGGFISVCSALYHNESDSGPGLVFQKEV